MNLALQIEKLWIHIAKQAFGEHVILINYLLAQDEDS
jgi:hypothetical protein